RLRLGPRADLEVLDLELLGRIAGRNLELRLGLGPGRGGTSGGGARGRRRAGAGVARRRRAGGGLVAGRSRGIVATTSGAEEQDSGAEHGDGTGSSTWAHGGFPSLVGHFGASLRGGPHPAIARQLSEICNVPWG